MRSHIPGKIAFLLKQGPEALINWNACVNQLLKRRSKKVSNIGFITVHGLNEGHIAPYTDIEFQLTKYQTYTTMKCQDKSLQLIICRNYYTIDKDKTCKIDGIKTIFHNRIKSRLYNKKAE